MSGLPAKWRASAECSHSSERDSTANAVSHSSGDAWRLVPLVPLELRHRVARQRALEGARMRAGGHAWCCRRPQAWKEHWAGARLAATISDQATAPGTSGTSVTSRASSPRARLVVLRGECQLDSVAKERPSCRPWTRRSRSRRLLSRGPCMAETLTGRICSIIVPLCCR